MASISFEDLKQLLMENCMLKSDPSEITPDTLFFGPGSLGLDSIDALQMTLAIEKKYGIPIKDPETARQVLRNLHTLREWLIRQSTC